MAKKLVISGYYTPRCSKILNSTIQRQHSKSIWKNVIYQETKLKSSLYIYLYLCRSGLYVVIAPLMILTLFTGLSIVQFVSTSHKSYLCYCILARYWGQKRTAAPETDGRGTTVNWSSEKTTIWTNTNLLGLV